MKSVLPMIAILIASPVFAHDGMHGPAASFDKDGDGTLSVAEYTAYLQAMKEDTADAAARFKTLDANADGKLSSGEMMRGTQKPKG